MITAPVGIFKQSKIDGIRIVRDDDEPRAGFEDLENRRQNFRRLGDVLTDARPGRRGR